MQQPRRLHLDAIHHIIRYLKDAPRQGLFFSSHSRLKLVGYCDADQARCLTTGRSVIRYYIFLDKALVSWKIKKQTTMSKFLAKAKYGSMAAITCKLTQLRYLLQDLHVYHHELARLFCDNQATIYITTNLVYHERTKHIKLDCHTIRERIQNGEIETVYVQTGKQVVDIFTKPLGQIAFKFHLNKLGVFDIHTPT